MKRTRQVYGSAIKRSVDPSLIREPRTITFLDLLADGELYYQNGSPYEPQGFNPFWDGDPTSYAAFPYDPLEAALGGAE